MRELEDLLEDSTKILLIIVLFAKKALIVAEYRIKSNL